MRQSKDPLGQTLRFVRCLKKDAEILLGTLVEIATTLDDVKTKFEQLPFEEGDLAELAHEANRLSGCLASATETYQADDFPDLNQLEDLASEAQTLATNLAETSEAE